MRNFLDYSLIAIAVILMLAMTDLFACPHKGVEKLPDHLVKPYCECYHRIMLEPRWVMPGRERAELICGGQAWDKAYRESRGKSK